MNFDWLKGLRFLLLCYLVVFVAWVIIAVAYYDGSCLFSLEFDGGKNCSFRSYTGQAVAFIPLIVIMFHAMRIEIWLLDLIVLTLASAYYGGHRKN